MIEAGIVGEINVVHVISNTHAKEIYPWDYGNVGAAVSVLLALIATIDFLSIN